MLRLVPCCVNAVTKFTNYNTIQERIFKWQIVITIAEAAAPAVVNGRIRGERQDPASFKKPAHKESHIKKVIGVVSGKGGVGKSMVTSLLAMALRRAGKQVAILDADVTGPSIPKTFGLHGQALMTDRGVFPMETRMGIKVIYGDVDFLLVDMPPGTGDVPLTVFQTMPVDGIIVVASPQELVGMIVEKACNMAKMMDIPVLSIVENFSYFKCPDCGKEHPLFGKSRLAETAAAHGVICQDKLPVDPLLAEAVDNGRLEEANVPSLPQTTELLLKML